MAFGIASTGGTCIYAKGNYSSLFETGLF